MNLENLFVFYLLPIIPILFFLLAFVWQAAVKFR